MVYALLFLLILVLVWLGPLPPLLTLHPSHVAGNGIGSEGCIALSSSLVHLSHLERMGLMGKCFWYRLFLSWRWGAEFVFVLLSREWFMRCCFFWFWFWFDWGRCHHFSLSIPHTLQGTVSALKVALRFRHLWFICLIWKDWISPVSVFDTGCSCRDVAFGCWICVCFTQ